MKKVFRGIIVCIALLGMTTGLCFAQANNEYPNGIEGIKGASVPPPGFYWRMYNVFYTADKLMDEDGDELDVDFDLNLFCTAQRFLWVSDFKLLGANYGASIIIPIFNVDLEIGALGIDDNEFGLGDICIEPLILAWHGPRYDAAFGLEIWAPTGEYDEENAASPGKDMGTLMFTGGATFYFDAEKTWSASVLARYEIHGEKDALDMTPGDDFHFEWGIGKTLAKVWDVGLAGYCQWQVSEDDGDDVSDAKDQVYAVGPEVSVFFPSLTMFLSLRSQWEFGAEDRSEGVFTTLTMTKIF